MLTLSLLGERRDTQVKRGHGMHPRKQLIDQTQSPIIISVELMEILRSV